MFSAALPEPAQRALGLMARSTVVRRFYLAGDTAAALQLGHRVSVDLDFFTRDAVDPEEIGRSFAAEQIKVDGRQTSPGTFKGVVANTNVSFFYYPYDVLEPLVPFEGIMLAALVDIGLMKMTAIGARGARRDFVDLYFILQKLGRRHLFDLFPRKYPSERSNLYHYSRNLVYFEDAEREPELRMLVPQDWRRIKSFFQESIRDLPFGSA